VLYTLYLKRRSPFGAVPGGIPGALPVLIGCAASAGTLRPEALALFALMLLWQPAHFWLLALACREDYRAAGIPVLPVVLGERYAKALIFLYATALVPASLALSFMGAASAPFCAFAALDGAAFLAACWRFTIRSDRHMKAFRASILYLALLLLAVVADSACRG
jgi:protoheme IX farnesyltransferase